MGCGGVEGGVLWIYINENATDAVISGNFITFMEIYVNYFI